MRRIPEFPLWIGHTGDVRDLRAVHTEGILALVDLAVNEAPAAVTRELVYCRFPLVDGTGNAPWLLRMAIDTLAGFLDAGTPTLVYCGVGMSRSLTIAAAAVAKQRGCPPGEALTLVTRSGAADVSPVLWHEVRAVLSK